MNYKTNNYEEALKWAVVHLYKQKKEGAKLLLVGMHRIDCLDKMQMVTKYIEQWIPVKFEDTLKCNHGEIIFPWLSIMVKSESSGACSDLEFDIVIFEDKLMSGLNSTTVRKWLYNRVYSPTAMNVIVVGKDAEYVYFNELEYISLPLISANGKYEYSSIYYGKSLSQHALALDAKMIDHYKWDRGLLAPCSYGFENLVNSIGSIFEKCNKDSSLDTMAEQCHLGWVDNYLYWRDHQPYLTGTYVKPYNPLNDERRDKCASTNYADLDEKEKEKDLFIASVVKGFME